MFNRLQIRIIFILLGIIAVFIAGFYFISKWEKNNLTRAVRDFELQQRNMLHSVITLQASSTQSMALDFSLWDEMVKFTETRDTSWARLNLKNSLQNYMSNHIWVFSPAFDLLYYAGNDSKSEIRDVLPDKNHLADITKESRFLHFFYKTRVGLVEIYGSPIQPMADTQRQSEPKGWFFTGKTWSNNLLKEMAQMTSSKLELDTSAIVTDLTGILDERSALVYSTYVLEGWSGRPIGALRSVTTFPFLQDYRQSSRYFLYTCIVFIVVLLFVISLMFFRFVELPLRYLNKTLELRDLRYIEPLKNYRTEFGRLTRSVQSVFEKEELLLETENRRKLESELRRSEQRFHLLVENLPDILWIANEEGDTIYYSSNLYQVTGYQPDEVIGNPEFWDMNIHPDDYQSVISRYSAFVENNYQFEVEYRLKHKNGEYLWISEKAISKFEHDGIQYCCGRISDITDEKLIELRLFESEQQFRALFEQNPLGVVLREIDDYTLINVNPAMCKMLGYTEDELIGLKINNITPAEDNEKEKVAAIAARKNGQSVFSIEKRLYRKDGDLIWVNITASYVKDKHGNDVYGFGIIEDITEKKHIQDNLAHEHNLLVSLMEHVPDLIFFKDREGKYMTCNQAAYDFFGKMGCPDPIGMTDNELFAEQNLYDEMRVDDISILDSGIPIINNVEKVELPGNETVWFSATRIPILSSDRKNDILVGILRNITERIETEIKLKQYAQELKELNLSKDKFVSILAHDLKNPFNAILGFASVLADEYEDYSDEERIHFIGNILQAAENTFNLIQNILEWSRSQTGRINFNPGFHDLSVIISESIKILKPAMDEKGVVVVSKVMQGTQVFVDENMMKTVLRNFISNAYKFSESKSIVRINCRPLHHNMLEVSVEDEGIGIPEEALDRLFKIDDSYRREGTQGEQGTGLGLILCKEFIEKNGGLIWVNSKEGQGSKFKFTVPLTREAMYNHDNSREL